MATVRSDLENDSTLERAKELFEINDGVLVWRTRKRGLSKRDWRVAGTVSHGYIRVRFDHGGHQAHRIVWALTYGRWPHGDIDHIDGDRTNNKVTNLRETTRSGNCKNASLRKDNRSGVVGVSFQSNTGMWEAYINDSGSRTRLGVFGTLLDAACARKSAEVKHGFHSGHGKIGGAV